MNSPAPLLCALAAGLLLPAASLPAPAHSAPGKAEAPTTRQLELKPGQAHSLTLPSNPTTGYQWQAQVEPASDAPVTVDISFVPPPTPQEGQPRLVGAPGRERITLTARHPGRAQVRLRYARPWEQPQGDDARLILHVTVTP